MSRDAVTARDARSRLERDASALLRSLDALATEEDEHPDPHHDLSAEQAAVLRDLRAVLAALRALPGSARVDRPEAPSDAQRAREPGPERPATAKRTHEPVRNRYAPREASSGGG